VLLAAGEEVKDIALRYERSTSAIYQRARLARLGEGLKKLFREKKLTLSQAAVLAGFDGEKQEAFLKEHGKKARISSWHVNEFLYKAQRCTLEYIADGECGACARRTRNTDPELFDDYKDYRDVCFDEGCWKRKWEAYLHGEIARAREAAGSDTNIIIYEGDPKFPEHIEELLSAEEGAKTIALEGKTFEVRSGDGYTGCSGDDGRKEFDAVCISSWREPPASVESYRKRKRGGEEEDEDEAARGVKLKTYLPDLSEGDAEAAEAELKKKGASAWGFEERVKERAMEIHIRRLGESGKEPAAGAIDRYFAHPYKNKNRLKKLWRIYSGKEWKGYSRAFKEYPAAGVFYLLCASGIGTYEMPDAGKGGGDPKDWKKKDFIKLSGLAAEEYGGLIAEAAGEVVREITGEGEGKDVKE
jgi:hypothetical protein